MAGVHLQLQLFTIFTIYTHVLAIYVTVFPTDQFVSVNDTVEFHCEVHFIGFNQLFWIFEFPDEITQPMTRHFVSAEQTTPIQLSDTVENHGKYNIEYAIDESVPGDTVHRLLLRIDEVLPADAGKFMCGYRFQWLQELQDVSLFKDWAQLTVIIPPMETLPSCGFEPSVEPNSVVVTLTCEMNGGTPLPSLMWYRENTALVEPSVESNAFRYELQPSDNGVEFVCTASGPSLEVGGSCSVIPLQINPSVSISRVSPTTVFETPDVVYTCSSFGIPRISTLEWLYNGQTFSNTMPVRYLIVDLSDSSSELHLFDVQFTQNNSNITCYVEIPSGLHSEQTVNIVVAQQTTEILPVTKFDNVTNNDRHNSNAGLPFAIPLAGALGGLIAVIVVVIIIILVYRRQNKKRGTQPEVVIIVEGSHDNDYQLSDVGTSNEPSGVLSEEPPEPYIISQIPGNTRAAAMDNDPPPYEEVNPRSSQINDNSSYDQLSRSHISAAGSPHRIHSSQAVPTVDNDHPYNYLKS